MNGDEPTVNEDAPTVNGSGGMLPLGMQTFREVRESGGFYVDKTAFAVRMIAEGKCYFLSRPRRFGKSLLVSTLKELFEGNEELFRGLFVHSRWDWSERRPVVRIDFSGRHFNDPDGLRANVRAQLIGIERRTGITVGHTDVPEIEWFALLLEELHRRSGRRVAVLVDEYDKPILDAIEDPDTARANRDFLRGLYGCLKFADEHVKFVFLTGVSKFSKVSLFSGLNNLKDVTLNPAYSTICGFTEGELDEVFAAQLRGLDRSTVRKWYNGYNWLGSERVYNPYDILLLFNERRFGAHWFETGTPKFLIDTLIERAVPTVSLGGTVAGEDLLSTFDVDYISTEALLFQTGYLTITGEEHQEMGHALYRLDYPNLEVRMSLNRALYRQLTQDLSLTQLNRNDLPRLLSDGDVEGMRTLLHDLYSKIPHQWYTNNAIAGYEGYYASVFYSYFAGQGFDITAEASSNRGRLDMTVQHAERRYIFEFKVKGKSKTPVSPLQQIIERGYADAYRAAGEPIHLVGIIFDPEQRNITTYETAQA